MDGRPEGGSLSHKACYTQSTVLWRQYINYWKFKHTVIQEKSRVRDDARIQRDQSRTLNADIVALDSRREMRREDGQ